MFTEMLVKGVALDPMTSTDLVILKDKEQCKSLTISIGLQEANAIITEMGKVCPPRPMTHDLLKNAIQAMGGKLDKITITDLRHNTFYAVIEVTSEGKKLELDARPSDAIALALRFQAPIMVSENVLKKSRMIDIEENSEKGESQKWKEFLEGLTPNDFGKYTM